MRQHNTRPKFLNLLQIRLPVMAVTSLAHRVSGGLLFLLTPALIYALSLSLRSPEDYRALLDGLQWWPMQMLALLAWWAVLHHLFAGVRFLLMDLDRGVRLPAAARSAWAVNLAALGLAVLTALGVWL